MTGQRPARDGTNDHQSGLVCEEKISTWRGDIRVECRCGAEYHARTGQLVEEPVCGLLSEAAK